MINEDTKRKLGEVLANCRETNSSHVKSLWASVELVKLDTDWFDEDVRLSNADGSNKLYIRPVVDGFAEDYQNYVILREFGLAVQAKASKTALDMWNRKLVIPSAAAIDTFQSRLKEKLPDYNALVDTFNTTTDRMVAIHIANALEANGQTIGDSANLDLKNWGPTMEFANCRRYYSITDLVNAYAPRSIATSFPSAFAATAVYGLSSVLRTEVSIELKGLVRVVVESAR